MGTIFTFLLKTKLGNILAILTFLGTIVLGILGWFDVHDRQVAAAATAQWNKHQLEIVLQEQARLRDLTSKLEELSAKSEQILQTQNEATADVMQKMQESIELQKLQGQNTTSSQVLKETVRRLQEGK